MKEKLTLVGDVHAKWSGFDRILKSTTGDVLQVGDMGIGFGKTALQWENRVRFIRGNHDNPAVCQNHPNYMGEYGFVNKWNLFYVSGAWSIDQNWRTPGLDWWPEEELSDDQLNHMLDMASKVSPLVDIVVTHDCPTFIFEKLFPSGGAFSKGVIPTRTTTALNELFKILRPKIWVFGHHHHGEFVEHEGTMFHCLGILEHMEVERDAT